MNSKKDLVSMKDMSEKQILEVLDTAKTMKILLDTNNKKSPHLHDKTVLLYFRNMQSKNKLGYDLAAKYLSASVADLSGAKEDSTPPNLVEVGKMMEQMGADFVVIRHGFSGSARYLAENISASVINAGDGNNENPVRSMLDLLTIKEKKGGFKGLKVAFIGDIENSRLTKSNIIALKTLGAQINVSGPPTLTNRSLKNMGINVYNTAIEAVYNCDVIFTVKLDDTKIYDKKLPSLNEYKTLFKIDDDLIANSHSDVIVLHPGAVKKGIEISSSVMKRENTLIDVQTTSPIAMNMAIYYLLSVGRGRR